MTQPCLDQLSNGMHFNHSLRRCRVHLEECENEVFSPVYESEDGDSRFSKTTSTSADGTSISGDLMTNLNIHTDVFEEDADGLAFLEVARLDTPVPISFSLNSESKSSLLRGSTVVLEESGYLSDSSKVVSGSGVLKDERVEELDHRLSQLEDGEDKDEGNFKFHRI